MPTTEALFCQGEIPYEVKSQNSFIHLICGHGISVFNNFGLAAVQCVCIIQQHKT